MKTTFFATVIGLGVLATGAAIASESCNIPKAEWQSRDALEQQLTAKGWKVKGIETDDGCYEATAIDNKGREVEAKFNPKTFDMVELEVEDDDDRGRMR